MPRICAVETALPPHKFGQEQARKFARQYFAGHVKDIERLLSVFTNAGIDTRYFSVPLEWFMQPHSLEEKNNTYINTATDLSAKVSRQLFDTCGIQPHDIDYVIYVNTTGLATPSIDARLINVLSLRKDIHRTPIWGLGCAGGAAGLSHAYHYALGHPEARILLVSTELCGLTFMHEDYSKSNLVATALFGEGSAAALVCGDGVRKEKCPTTMEIVSTQSSFYPDSLDVMGWNVVSEGLQVVFDRRIPDIVAENAAEDLSVFLKHHDLAFADIDHFLFHPGGVKVLEAYESALGVDGNRFAYARNVLRKYGNMSSATILFVIREFLTQNSDGKGGHALLSALGPGFSSESLLVKLMN